MKAKPKPVAKPGDTWKDWPRKVFVCGDLVRVNWGYLGVHGPVSCEDFYLLLNLKKIRGSRTEFWDVLQYNQDGSRSVVEITCHDYRNATDEDWHEVTLISRVGEPNEKS